MHSFTYLFIPYSIYCVLESFLKNDQTSMRCALSCANIPTVPDHSSQLHDSAILWCETPNKPNHAMTEQCQIDICERLVSCKSNGLSKVIYLLLTHRIGGCIDTLLFRLGQR